MQNDVPKINWLNMSGVVFVHIMAVVALCYLSVHYGTRTLALGVCWFFLCHFSISAGYHRLFAHHSYKTIPILRAIYLFFGAASVQNSALKWCVDHRRHHSNTDQEADPYNIKRGLWWAHIGWVLHLPKEKSRAQGEAARFGHDLASDRLVCFQHRYYLPLAFAGCVIVPAGLGALWGDALGGVLVAGFLRLAVQWQITFALNSFAHSYGSQPYSVKSSARDNVLIALLTFGEGYHNYHHRFPSDYRNGVRWYQYDPTKWFVWLLARIGLAWDLHKSPQEAIRRAREHRAGVSSERV